MTEVHEWGIGTAECGKKIEDSEIRVRVWDFALRIGLSVATERGTRNPYMVPVTSNQ